MNKLFLKFVHLKFLSFYNGQSIKNSSHNETQFSSNNHNPSNQMFFLIKQLKIEILIEFLVLGLLNLSMEVFLNIPIYINFVEFFSIQRPLFE